MNPEQFNKNSTFDQFKNKPAEFKPNLDDKFEKVINEEGFDKAKLEKEFMLPEEQAKELTAVIGELSDSKKPLEKIGEILDRKKISSLLAVSLWHLQRMNSTYSHEEIEKREKLFKEKREKYWIGEDFVKVAKGLAGENYPAWCGPLIIAAFSEEKEKMSKENGEKMSVLAMKSVSRMFSAMDKGIEINKKFGLGEDGVMNKEAEKKFEENFYNGMLRRSSRHSKGRFLLKIRGKEFRLKPSDILRPLARKGLLNWGELLEEKDRKNIEEYIKKYFMTSIDNELSLEMEHKQTINECMKFDNKFPISPNSKKVLNESFGSDNFSLIGSRELRKEINNNTDNRKQRMTSFNCAPSFGEVLLPPIVKIDTSEMPGYDFRINFEMTDKKDVDYWSNILGQIYAESCTEGWPIMSKITDGDITDKRLLIYADYYTVVHILDKLKKYDLRPMTKKEPAKLISNKEKTHLFPFGENIYMDVRRTGEETDIKGSNPEKELEDISKKFPFSRMMKLNKFDKS